MEDVGEELRGEPHVDVQLIAQLSVELERGVEVQLWASLSEKVIGEGRVDVHF